MDAEKMSAAKKWAMIGLLTFFGRAIANVPYMREVSPVRLASPAYLDTSSEVF